MTYEVGIDLGTTYTAAAVHRDGRSSIFPLGSRAAAIPSVVYLKEGGEVLTGEAAVRRAITEPERVAREFKRRLGDHTPIIVGGTPYSAEALMARIFRAVLDQVETREGSAPSRIVISHPANWGHYKLDLLEQAIRMAEIDGDKVTLLSEPEAAALSYASQERVDEGEVIAVYDLGGGTFDAAVLRRTEHGFEIIGKPEGIERLGGIDFDAAVAAHVARSLDGALEEVNADDASAIAAMSRLRQDCVDAKEALSSDTDATIPVLLPTLQTDVRITRSEFEALIRPSLVDSIGAMHRAVRSADVSWDQVSKVLLVGGSSRVPLISQMVASELGRPVAVDAHPKHAVALGAAFAASEEGVSASEVIATPPVAAPPDAPPADPTPAEPTPSVGTASVAAAAAAAAAFSPPIDAAPSEAAAEVPAAPPPTSAPASPTPAAPQNPLPPPDFADPTRSETPVVPAAAAEPVVPAPSAETAEPLAARAPIGAAVPPMTPPVRPTSRSTESISSDGDSVAASSGGGSRLPLIAALVAVVAVVVIGGFLVASGGGDDDAAATDTTEGTADDTDSGDETTTTAAPATTTEAPTTTVAPPTADEVSAAVAAVVSENFSTVEASIEGDTVTLTGRAFDETEQGDAIAAVEALPGVAVVDDQTEVQTDDERCTEMVRSQPNWGCVTGATFDGSTISGTYYSSVDEGGPAFSINSGLHLHVYASTFEPTAVGTAGPFSDGTGAWQVWDTPEVIEVSLTQLGVSEMPEKLCALIANQIHTIESLNSGTCWPIEVLES